MKRANIFKFNSNYKTILHPIKTLDQGGGIATSPFLIKEKLKYKDLVKDLLDILDCSESPIKSSELDVSNTEYLKLMGFKTMKELHDGSINVGIYTKEGNYYICPTINKGSRQGFHHSKEEIVIPIQSSLDDLACALQEAFEKCS